MTSLTPTVRQGLRASAFWIGAAVLVLLLAIGSLLVVGQSEEAVPLSPESAAPDGTRALAEVLRGQGIAVVVTTSLDDTAAAVDSGAAGAAIVMHDPEGILSDDQRDRLATLSPTLVLLDPDFATLRSLAPGVAAAGTPDDDPLDADCALAELVAVDEASPAGSAYRVTGADGTESDSGADDTDSGSGSGSKVTATCLRSESDDAPDAYSLVRLESGDRTTTVLGATGALTNGTILDLDNAALALTLLGTAPRLVWYLPSPADAATPTTAELSPPWVSPLIVLAVLTAIAAAVWRGRRFGPLIVENLPVVVRARETMEGRARLYQSSSARLRALDAIRVGTISRLATRCGLSSRAAVEEVVLAVAAAVGADPGDIRSTLLDTVPNTDAELVRLSDRLLEIEAAVRAAAPR